MERLTVRVGGNVYYSNNGSPLLPVEIQETPKAREILYKLAMYEDMYEGRNTPKKPIENFYDEKSEDDYDDGYYYSCVECENEVGKFSKIQDEWIYQNEFCEKCGQKINWD